jgi:hypothetical protein
MIDRGDRGHRDHSLYDIAEKEPTKHCGRWSPVPLAIRFGSGEMIRLCACKMQSVAGRYSRYNGLVPHCPAILRLQFDMLMRTDGNSRCEHFTKWRELECRSRNFPNET